MIKKWQILVISLSLLVTNPFYGQNVTVDEYKISVDVNDTLLNIEANLNISNCRQNNYLLFNSDITGYKIETNDSKFSYFHKNDTLFFNSSKKNICLNITYRILWSSDMNSPKHTIAQSDKFQFFLERYYKWYPLLYDNFANYHLSVTVDSSLIVFAYTTADNTHVLNNTKTYIYNIFDEDIPLLISKLNVFNHKVVKNNGTNFNFYFLKDTKRLLEVKNNKPTFTYDNLKIDSINNKIYDRCIKIVKWYKSNLVSKKIEDINFVESTNPAMGGFGLNNLIYLTTQMINYDLYYKYQISHEIGHIWLGLNTKYEAKGRNFIAESVDEYVNLLLYEDFFGRKEFDKLLQEEFVQSTSSYSCSFENVLNARKNFNSSHEDRVYIDALIYKKGVLFLNEFRNLIGRDTFLKIINDTYTQEKKLISLTDLENNIKKYNLWEVYVKLFDLKL